MSLCVLLDMSFYLKLRWRLNFLYLIIATTHKKVKSEVVRVLVLVCWPSSVCRPRGMKFHLIFFPFLLLLWSFLFPFYLWVIFQFPIWFWWDRVEKFNILLSLSWKKNCNLFSLSFFPSVFSGNHSNIRKEMLIIKPTNL